MLHDNPFRVFAADYAARLAKTVSSLPLENVEFLAQRLFQAWQTRQQVFIFGNGGSAGNAIHLANDFLYGVSKKMGHALRVNALPANSSVLTCLANDLGYESIFSAQLAVLAQPGDIVIALSGSGNSPNVVNALQWCNHHDIESFAILGYGGGQAKSLASHSIHVAIDDMQISEDLQLIVGHMLMQWLSMHHETTLVEADSLSNNDISRVKHG